MGDRYIMEITCPKCGEYDDEVYYAPTCGFIDWECNKCGYTVDLEKHTGISKESCSNKIEIEGLVNQMTEKKGDE